GGGTRHERRPAQRVTGPPLSHGPHPRPVCRRNTHEQPALPIFGGPPSPDSAVGRCFIGGPAPGPDAEKTCDAAEDDDLRQVCNGNLDRARQAPSGWLRDRSHQCFTKRIDMIAVRDQDGAPAGDTLDLWMLGWANNGIRQSDYAVSAEDITVSSGADVAAAQPGI